MTLGTLFSGGGLFDAGLRDLFDIRLAVEYDAKIAEVYRANFGDHVINASVCDVDYKPFRGLDLLHASPPCPAFSVANKNAGERDEDISLSLAVCRAIVEIDPRMFTLENVQGYDGSESLKLILATLDKQGYVWQYATYNAADFGVPQTRKRLFLRAWKRSHGHLPAVKPTHAKKGKETASVNLFDTEPRLPWVGWYEAIEDLIPTLPECDLAPWQKKRLGEEFLETLLFSKDDIGQTIREARVPRASEPTTTLTATCMRRPITSPLAVLVEGDAAGERKPTTKNDSETSFTIKANGGGRCHKAVLVWGEKAQSQGRKDIAAEKPSQTVTAQTGGSTKAVLVGAQGYQGQVQTVSQDEPAFVPNTTSGAGAYRAHLGYKVVAMTPRCLARFQSVPDWYRLPESKSLAGKVIGNGVASLFARSMVISMLGDTK